MSDSDQPAEGVPKAQPEAPAETPAADSQPENQTSQASSEPAKEPAQPAAGEPAKPTESKAQEDSKPKSRRSAEFRIGQLTAQRDEWKTKYEELIKNKGGDEGDPPPSDPPDISKQVEAEIDKRLKPVLSQHSQAADDGEINELFTGANAARRSEYEPKIREAWKLDQYKDMAASDLLKLFSYDSDLAKAKLDAVEEYKKAQKEARESSGSGASARSNNSGEKSAWDLSDEEFKAQQNKLRQQQG